MLQLIKSHKINFIFFIIMCVLAICFWTKQSGSLWRNVDVLETVDSGWYYMDGNNKVNVTLPAKIDNPKMKTITIYNDELSSRGASKILSTYAAKYHIKMFADDKMIFETREFGLKRNDAVLSKELCFAHLSDKPISSRIGITYYDEDGSFKIPEVYIGSWKATLMDLATRNLYTIIITLFIIVLSFLSIILAILLRKKNDKAPRLFFLGAFLFVAGMWCLSDSAMVEMFTGYGNTIYYLDFYCFMFMPIPMLYYMMSYKELRKYKFFLTASVVFYANIIVQTILACAEIYTFFDMLFITHILMMIMVLSTLFILFKRYHEKRNERIKNLIIAFLMLGVFSIISIILYSFVHFAAYQRIFQTGLLLFIIVLMYSIVLSLIHSMKYQAQVETYRTMSQRDNLTKLQNRRSFDLITKELMKNNDKYSNVSLIYMDINNLKYVNDTFGHLAGDQLILGAARSIEHAFSESGYCFRLGGDEFCVIITCEVPQDQIVARLQEQVDEVNAEPDFENKLTIAIGCSYLMDPNGNARELSEWIEEADNKMYEDKKKKKGIM